MPNSEEGITYDGRNTYISLERLKDGKPLHLTGGDYELPGPNGSKWVLIAATGTLSFDEGAGD